MLISFAVTAKLIYVFVFAYAKSWFSQDAAHIVKLGLIRVYIVFLNFAVEHRLWVLNKNVLVTTRNLCFEQNFYLKIGNSLRCNL